MSNSNKRKRVRITRADKQRSPEAVRGLGKALIALARAQLEAGAEAEVAALNKKATPLKGSKLPDAQPDSGDAA